MKKVKNHVDSEVLRKAIHQVAGLTPDEISLFFKYSKTTEDFPGGGSLSSDIYYLILELSPEEFFRKLSDFIRFKKEMIK